jgi:hypothetical protein
MSRATNVKRTFLRTWLSILTTLGFCFTICKAAGLYTVVWAVTTVPLLEEIISQTFLTGQIFLTLLQHAPLEHGFPGAHLPCGS